MTLFAHLFKCRYVHRGSLAQLNTKFLYTLNKFPLWQLQCHSIHFYVLWENRGPLQWEHCNFYTLSIEFLQNKKPTCSSGTSATLCNTHHSHKFRWHCYASSLKIFSALICLLFNWTSVKCFVLSQAISLILACTAPLTNLNLATAKLDLLP